MMNGIAYNDYRQAFPAALEQLSGKDSLWLTAYRHAGFQAFNEQGFPDHRHEDWRYTSLSTLSKAAFLSIDNQDVDPALIASARFADSHCVVLLNGRFSEQHSRLTDLPAGIKVQALQQLLASDNAKQVQSLLGKAVAIDQHSLVAFNAAWFSDGIQIEVSANTQSSKPLQILHVVTQPQALAATRQIIELKQGAQLEIIESYVSNVDQYFTVAVNECFLGQQAKLTWYKLQTEALASHHFGGIYVQQSEQSQFSHHNFAFGSLLARNDIHSQLAKAAECTLNGLVLANNKQHIDNHTRIVHSQPNGKSREFYKAVLDQRARGVFQGRIIVAQDAQHTDSEMTNKNLLLSTDAEIDSKPQLEIYADDVKCSHGVTVGQLDEKSLFFLQARGIDSINAKEILTFAFANEMVDKIDHPDIRDYLQKRLLSQFPNIRL